MNTVGCPDLSSFRRYLSATMAIYWWDRGSQAPAQLLEVALKRNRFTKIESPRSSVHMVTRLDERSLWSSVAIEKDGACSRF